MTMTNRDLILWTIGAPVACAGVVCLSQTSQAQNLLASDWGRTVLREGAGVLLRAAGDVVARIGISG
jgi:hypothetical protein